jgi:hypothetical protein
MVSLIADTQALTVDSVSAACGVTAPVRRALKLSQYVVAIVGSFLKANGSKGAGN